MDSNRKLLSRQTLLSDTAILIYLALFKLILHWLTSGGYGYFRDEFYYIAASQRLQWGYLEFPPMIAFITAFTRWLLGESLFALHFFPALAGALIVLLAGLMARELGGGRWAQALAALAVIVAPVFLAMNSILTMDSFDELWWVLAAYIVLRLLKQDNPKLWLWFGLIAGLGLMTKITLAYFGAALVIGLLLTPSRKYLASKWLWLGGLIALAFLLPYIGWQVANGWPTLEFWRMYASGKTYPVTPVEFVLQQIVILNPLTLPLWLAGLFYYLFAKAAKPYRALGVIYAILFVMLMAIKAKNYFLAPAYPMLLAAGAVVFERFAARPRWNWAKPSYASLVLISGVLIAPMALPVLPVEMFVRYAGPLGGDAGIKSERLATAELPQYFADRFGWENLTATVARVYQALPPEDRATACIFGNNYGETGAINFLGRAYGLPQAISGHNQHYLWGPGNCTGEVMIVVGVPRQDLVGVFDSVTVGETARCSYCMPYESNLPVLIGRGLRVPLKDFWPRVRNYS
jgi:4-amino-4-deoxy-L-arabinose transferase-like glycosyltransferase